jgi:protein TonB
VLKVEPVYPAEARIAELEGDVQVRFVVGEDGTVRDVTVLKSTHSMFNQAARTAVMQYKYKPRQRNGVPEPVTLEITVSFKLR